MVGKGRNNKRFTKTSPDFPKTYHHRFLTYSFVLGRQQVPKPNVVRFPVVNSGLCGLSIFAFPCCRLLPWYFGTRIFRTVFSASINPTKCLIRNGSLAHYQFLDCV